MISVLVSCTIVILNSREKILTICLDDKVATNLTISLILCSTWAKRSQRSARIQPTPLRPPRSCVWGSQSNLLDLEPAEPQERGTADADLQRKAEPHLLHSSGSAHPMAGLIKPALEAGQHWQVDGQSEAHEVARELCQDAAQPEDQAEIARVLHLAIHDEAGECQSALEGQHATSLNSPSQMESSWEDVKPNNAIGAAAEELGSGKDLLALPMQPPISDVAKVCIEPTAGTMLGALATRSRRPKKAGIASLELTASSPAEAPTPDQGLQAGARPNHRIAASARLRGKHGLGQAGSHCKLDQAAEERLSPGSTGKAAPLRIDKEDNCLSAPQPAVQMQTPLANLGHKALSASKRSRSSLAAPQHVCKRPG